MQELCYNGFVSSNVFLGFYPILTLVNFRNFLEKQNKFAVECRINETNDCFPVSVKFGLINTFVHNKFELGEVK